MNNQYDDLDIDVQNLFLDESDVGATVELKSAYGSPNHCARGGGRNSKILVGCPVMIDIFLKIMILNFCWRS